MNQRLEDSGDHANQRQSRPRTTREKWRKTALHNKATVLLTTIVAVSGVIYTITQVRQCNAAEVASQSSIRKQAVAPSFNPPAPAVTLPKELAVAPGTGEKGPKDPITNSARKGVPKDPTPQASTSTFQQTNQPGSIGVQGTGNNVVINPSVGWPSISADVLNDAVQYLKPYAGQHVRIEAPNGADSNRLRVVQELTSMLTAAGWKCEPGKMLMGFGASGQPMGLGVQVQKVTPAVDMLVRVLAGLYGIENIPDRRQNDSFEDGVIIVWVWPKKP